MRLQNAGEVPLGLLEDLRKADLKAYETNRCKLETSVRLEGVPWRLEVRAERSSFPLQWEIKKIHVQLR